MMMDNGQSWQRAATGIWRLQVSDFDEILITLLQVIGKIIITLQPFIDYILFDNIDVCFSAGAYHYHFVIVILNNNIGKNL